MRKIHNVYFSPTDTTKKIVSIISDELILNIKNVKLIETNITHPQNRNITISLSNADILVLGFPVYGGRIPEIIEDSMKKLRGKDTKAILIALYGNRDFDDALLEMKDILTTNGFNVVAACAFIGEHSYTKNVAAKRPDASDIKIANEFGFKIYKKISNTEISKDLYVKGNHPYKERRETPKFAPYTNDNCFKCGICSSVCPVNAIDESNPKLSDENKCIKCCACIKKCPVQAKGFNNENIKNIIKLLETNFSQRKEPEIFI